MPNFINSQIILNHLNANAIPVLHADTTEIVTPYVTIRPTCIFGTTTGEIISDINFDRNSPNFNDEYPEDLADENILYLIINDYVSYLKENGWA